MNGWREILRGVVGSTSHGTAIEGQDDRDEMGIFIELPENVCGLFPCEHYIYRDQPEGVRSQPGDLDLTLYSLRKFCRLAAQGNPSVVILLWLPHHIVKHPLGAELIAIREAFISKDSGRRFLGYLTAQKMSLTGERTQKVNRPDLIARYGYDTKFLINAGPSRIWRRQLHRCTRTRRCYSPRMEHLTSLISSAGKARVSWKRWATSSTAWTLLARMRRIGMVSKLSGAWSTRSPATAL